MNEQVLDNDILNKVKELILFIQRSRFDISTEKRLQEDMEKAFKKAGISFKREFILSDRDIPDFFLQGGIVIECKIRNVSKKMDIYKQLKRYSEHEEVKALILASNVSMTLPPDINGKPVFMASISRGWM